MADHQRYLTKQQVAQRYGVTDRTVTRWEKTYEIGFPRAMVVNTRRLYNVAALEAWERLRASISTQAAAA